VPDEDGHICVPTSAQAIDVVADCCLAVGIEKLSVFVEAPELVQELETESVSLATNCKQFLFIALVILKIFVVGDLSVNFLTAQHAKQLLVTMAESLTAAYYEKHPTQIPPFSISVEELDALVESRSTLNTTHALPHFCLQSSHLPQTYCSCTTLILGGDNGLFN
jgi:hypothetical protein